MAAKIWAGVTASNEIDVRQKADKDLLSCVKKGIITLRMKYTNEFMLHLYIISTILADRMFVRLSSKHETLCEQKTVTSGNVSKVATAVAICFKNSYRQFSFQQMTHTEEAIHFTGS